MLTYTIPSLTAACDRRHVCSRTWPTGSWAKYAGTHILRGEHRAGGDHLHDCHIRLLWLGLWSAQCQHYREYHACMLRDLILMSATCFSSPASYSSCWPWSICSCTAISRMSATAAPGSNCSWQWPGMAWTDTRSWWSSTNSSSSAVATKMPRTTRLYRSQYPRVVISQRSRWKVKQSSSQAAARRHSIAISSSCGALLALR